MDSSSKHTKVMFSVVHQICFGGEFTPALLTSMVKPIQNVTMHGSSLQFTWTTKL